MATFKVGQRVRIVYSKWGLEGRETIIHRIPSLRADSDCDFFLDGERWAANFSSLAPLTDPGADAFIERIKKLKPEPVVPVPEHVKEQN